MSYIEQLCFVYVLIGSLYSITLSLNGLIVDDTEPFISCLIEILFWPFLLLGDLNGSN